MYSMTLQCIGAEEYEMSSFVYVLPERKFEKGLEEVI